jgi:glycylpeptide N-tetradecanoyltransferase
MADQEKTEPIEPTGTELPKPAHVESEAESGEDNGPAEPTNAAAQVGDAAGGKKKKKKRKTKKLKQMLGLGKTGEGEGANQDAPKPEASGSLTMEQLDQLLKLNPALANELKNGEGSSLDGPEGSVSAEHIQEVLKKLKLHDVLTGLASGGKNRKDMASYKFWATQPVPQFNEETGATVEEGPLKIQTVEEIPEEPTDLVLDQFCWETIDLTDDAQMEEVYKLLNGHYVEDDESMFRFKYSTSILKW